MRVFVLPLHSNALLTMSHLTSSYLVLRYIPLSHAIPSTGSSDNLTLLPGPTRQSTFALNLLRSLAGRSLLPKRILICSMLFGELGLGLFVPVIDELVQERAGFACVVAILLCLFAFLGDVVAGFFVAGGVLVEIGWNLLVSIDGCTSTRKVPVGCWARAWS